MSDENLDRPDLDALLMYWQPTLLLQDWKLSVRYAHAHEMPSNSVACCSPNFRLRVNPILVLEPAERRKDWAFEEDPEADLVHECVHTIFAGFMRDESHPENQLMEQAVEHIAQILMGMQREIERLQEELETSGAPSAHGG